MPIAPKSRKWATAEDLLEGGPRRLPRRAPGPGESPGESASTGVAAACFRARLAGEPSPAGERTAWVPAPRATRRGFWPSQSPATSGVGIHAGTRPMHATAG